MAVTLSDLAKAYLEALDANRAKAKPGEAPPYSGRLTLAEEDLRAALATPDTWNETLQVSEHEGRVVVSFGAEVSWFAMSPEDAAQLAASLLTRARQITFRCTPSTSPTKENHRG